MRHVALVGSLALGLLICGCFGSPPGQSTTSVPASPTTRPVTTPSTTRVAQKTPTVPPVATAPAPTKASTAVPTPARTSGVGNQILFARGNDIWAVDRNSREARKVIEGGHDFSWSPSGDRIVFVRGQGNDAEVWTAKSDGSGQVRITHNDWEDVWPVWSPDERTICFTSSPVALLSAVPWQWSRSAPVSGDEVVSGTWAGEAEVWLVNGDGANPRRLAQGFAATWAPEGKRLAFHRLTKGPKAHIAIVNSEGRNEWTLATSSAMEGPVSGGLFYGQPAWSPDGRDLVYGVASYAMLSDWGLLRRAPTLSKGATSIVGQSAGFFARVSYSPDGQLVVADSYGSGGRGPTDALDVFWLGQPSSGDFYTQPIQMVATKVLSVQGAHSPAWSPDSRQLAYAASGSIWVWDRSSQQVARLIDNVEVNAGLSWGGR